MADDPADTIVTNSQAPRRASADNTSAEQHPIPDQIAADKYRASKQGLRTANLGIRRIKLEPPGTI